MKHGKTKTLLAVGALLAGFQAWGFLNAQSPAKTLVELYPDLIGAKAKKAAIVSFGAKW